MSRRASLFRIVAAILLCTVGRAGAAGVWSATTDLDPRDPLELSGGTVIDGTATILALFDDPSAVNELVTFNVPIADPNSAVSQDVPTSSSSIFGLSHRIHTDSNGTGFASIIDDVDASNPPFELVSLRTGDGLNWTRTTVASGVDYRSSEMGIAGNDDIFVAGLDATNLKIDVFKSTDGGSTFALHRSVTAEAGNVGIVGAAFGAQRFAFVVNPSAADTVASFLYPHRDSNQLRNPGFELLAGADCVFYAELLAGGTRVDLKVDCANGVGGGAASALQASLENGPETFDNDQFVGGTGLETVPLPLLPPEGCCRNTSFPCDTDFDCLVVDPFLNFCEKPCEEREIELDDCDAPSIPSTNGLAQPGNVCANPNGGAMRVQGFPPTYDVVGCNSTLDAGTTPFDTPNHSTPAPVALECLPNGNFLSAWAAARGESLQFATFMLENAPSPRRAKPVPVLNNRVLAVVVVVLSACGLTALRRRSRASC